jgi:hypothetical protein
MSVRINSGPFEPYEWPTREQWAEQRRNNYWDSESPHPYLASRRLSNYASAAEIAAVIVALQEAYRDYGRQMRAAKALAGPLARQRGEGSGPYIKRYLAMSEAEQDIAGEPDVLRVKRREVNEVLKQLREDWVPWRWAMSSPPPLDAIMARYEAAVRAGDEKWIAEVAAAPIDDAAWAEELERRRDIERRHPDWFA